jgi:hypothetical protein
VSDHTAIAHSWTSSPSKYARETFNHPFDSFFFLVCLVFSHSKSSGGLYTRMWGCVPRGVGGDTHSGMKRHMKRAALHLYVDKVSWWLQGGDSSRGKLRQIRVVVVGLLDSLLGWSCGGHWSRCAIAMLQAAAAASDHLWRCG